jgi:hypothetical protein
MAWSRWYFWRLQKSKNPFHASEFDLMDYLCFLFRNKKSYSVLNLHKSMLLQTLPFFGNSWCTKTFLISRFMKGIFNVNPPRVRYKSTWDVSIVLNYLKGLFPLCKLNLKMLTLKLTALIALACAPRAQTMVSMDLDNMCVEQSQVVFFFPNLLKTTQAGRSNNYVLNLKHFPDEQLCVMHTLLYYISVTKTLRKSKQLLVSYVTYDSVSTSTIARWLKTVLYLSGVDVNIYKAHSYRSASVSKAYQRCSLKTILDTANWKSDKNFHKFYCRSANFKSNVSFDEAVFSIDV